MQWTFSWTRGHGVVIHVGKENKRLAHRVKELRRRAQNGWKRGCRMYSLSNVGYVQNLEGPNCGNRDLAARLYYYLEEIFLAERGSHTNLSSTQEFWDQLKEICFSFSFSFAGPTGILIIVNYCFYITIIIIIVPISQRYLFFCYKPTRVHIWSD